MQYENLVYAVNGLQLSNNEQENIIILIYASNAEIAKNYITVYQQQNQHIGDQRSCQIGDQHTIHLLCGNVSIDIAVSPMAVYAVVAAGQPAADIHMGQLLCLIRPSNRHNQLVPHNIHADHFGDVGSLHAVFLNQ